MSEMSEGSADVKSSFPELRIELDEEEIVPRTESRFLQDMQSPKSFASVESLKARNLDVEGFYSASEDEEEEESEDDDNESFEPSYGGAWQHEIDRHGRSYVFNRTTGESRWLENESHVTSPSPPSPLLSPIFDETPHDRTENHTIKEENPTTVGDSVTWTPYTDENGYTYYYNELTGVSRWSLPEETEDDHKKSPVHSFELDTFVSELNDAEMALAEISVELAGTIRTSPQSDENGRAQVEILHLRERLRQVNERQASEKDMFTKRLREVEKERDTARTRNQILLNYDDFEWEVVRRLSATTKETIASRSANELYITKEDVGTLAKYLKFGLRAIDIERYLSKSKSSGGYGMSLREFLLCPFKRSTGA
eukprot:g3704.t1